MSGFPSRFRENASTGRPPRTYGATANAWASRFSPLRNRFVSSPQRNVASLRSPPFSVGRGGHRNFGLSRALRQTKWEQIADAPDPCNTLKARLSLQTYLAQRMPFRINMKSVDRTPVEFRKRFSGRPGEDWIGHLDLLEIHRANKHQWTAREFYYGLQHTLAGKALTTVQHLEQGLECPDLTAFLPNWFECDMQELRLMVAGKISFPELEPRSKVAIIISYFQNRFQQTSAKRAMEDFQYATQAEEESIEEWGIRIGRLKRALERFGRFVSYEEYLKKWKSGTRAAYFTAKLRQATRLLGRRS